MDGVDYKYHLLLLLSYDHISIYLKNLYAVNLLVDQNCGIRVHLTNLHKRIETDGVVFYF